MAMDIETLNYEAMTDILTNAVNDGFDADWRLALAPLLSDCGAGTDPIEAHDKCAAHILTCSAADLQRYLDHAYNS